MEIEIEVLTMPCSYIRMIIYDNFIRWDSYRQKLWYFGKNTKQKLSRCTSGKQINENKVADDDCNGLASVVTQKIHTINKAGDFGHAWIIDIIQKHL